MQVHQILPFFTFGDAIGNLVLEVRRVLKEWGYVSEIYAENWDRRLAGECHSFEEYLHRSRSDNLLILHYSTGGQVNRFVLDLPDRVILYYHNITPARYFYWVNGALAQELQEARSDLTALAGRAPAISDSSFDQQELVQMGFRALGVVPPIFSFAHLLDKPGGSMLPGGRPEKQGTMDWLSVGRLAPNKCLQDVVKAFYYFHTWIQPRSRLFLVGSTDGMEPYVDQLKQLVARLGLEGAVIFAGRVDALAPYYRIADIYVSMSEHEGFCIPLVEAMHFGVPILAYASTSVPATLGGAGVLFKSKDHRLIAEAAQEIVGNAGLRERLCEGERVRLQAFQPAAVRAQFRTCLDRA